LQLLERWSLDTETGDVSELAGLAENDPIWPHVTSSSETRLGTPCPHFAECFVTRLRRDAEASRLIIVNHHLFFADLALRGPHPGSVLPDYDAVVFDEAHRLEDVASLYFGTRVSRARCDRLERDLERAIVTDPLGPGRRVVDLLQGAFGHFWEVLRANVRGGEPRLTLERDFWIGGAQQAYFGVDQALEGVAAFLQTSSVTDDERIRQEVAELLSRRLSTLRDELATIVDGASGSVIWLDVAPMALSSTPVDLSSVLQDRLFERVPSVVLTSATLATTARPKSIDAGSSSPFAYIRRRLGLVDAVATSELIVESPFDFEQNALLYTPSDLPPAGTPGFLETAADRVLELVKLTDGGAFVLTTSLKSMRGLHQLLQTRLDQRPLFVQGQAPKQALISAFRAAGDAVLVATQSFWEGVDVPGQALRLVVLEKLPFFVPSDPIVKARSLAIERDGGNPFMELFVPGAAIALKQGFGRLIRSKSDVGVVALFDERVHTRGYGQRLLAALPPARRTASLDEVAAFWARATATS
jgi:ATP-dependent DNA helicase DinG